MTFSKCHSELMQTTIAQFPFHLGKPTHIVSIHNNWSRADTLNLFLKDGGIFQFCVTLIFFFSFFFLRASLWLLSEFHQLPWTCPLDV